MTVELPQIGLIGMLYIMAFLSFIVCYLANHQSTDKANPITGFWVFISVISGITLMATFVLATLLLIVRNYNPGVC